MTPEALRSIRESQNLTREELAQKLGCSASAIVHWEGKTREIPAWVEDKLMASYELKASLGFLQELFEIARDSEISFDTLLSEAIQDIVAKRKAQKAAKEKTIAFPTPVHDLKVAEDSENYGDSKA